MEIKTPWVVVPGVIVITTIIATIFSSVLISYSQDANCLLQHLITNKEIIDSRISNNELEHIDNFKDNVTTEREYYYAVKEGQTGNLKVASDLLEPLGKIIKREYFINETNEMFALSYFDRNNQKVCNTKYYCNGNITGTVIPPGLCINPSTGI